MVFRMSHLPLRFQAASITLVLMSVFGLGAGWSGAVRATEAFARACDPIGDTSRARLPKGVALRGCLELDRSGPAADLPASELSGLAYDAKAGLLYSVSDRGWMLWLRPEFRDHYLVNVRREAAYRLQGSGGRTLKQPVDVEAVVLTPNPVDTGSTGLLMGFESPARVAYFSVAGLELGGHGLPAILANPKTYRSPNDGFEALALTALGPVVSPQRPLRGEPQTSLRLYSLATGQAWDYPPLDPKHSSLADLATLPDGRLLALERVYAGVFRPLRIALRRFSLSATSNSVSPETLVEFSSDEGWRVDNFEGLAVVDAQHVLMVTDDNQSAWQRTLLWYVELPL